MHVITTEMKPILTLLIILRLLLLSTVLWRCCLCSRKGICKLSGEVLVWLSVWSDVQMICIWST